MSELRKNYFLDTEFMEDGRTIELLSIGIVCEDGREYYAVNRDADRSKANPWVQKHVLPALDLDAPECIKPREQIRDEVLAFIIDGLLVGDLKPRLWGYFADYDWVVFCQLFGRMVDLPTWLPYFCMDLKQWSVMLGDPEHPPQTNEHHALADARWNLALYKVLLEHEQRRSKAP